MLRWSVAGEYIHQFEHRRVWEDAHGPIPDGYVVHHLNEDKLDNRLDNLCLMRRGDHGELHNRMYFTREQDLAARRIAAKRSRDKRRLDPEWVEKERARGREKHYRLKSAR